MCKRFGEAVDYLLLQCPIAYELWTMVFRLFGIHWVMLPRASELFASWQGNFSQHHDIAFWRFVLHLRNRALNVLRDANVLLLRSSLSSSILCSSGAQLYKLLLFLLFLFCLTIVFWDLNCIIPTIDFLCSWVCFFIAINFLLLIKKIINLIILQIKLYYENVNKFNLLLKLKFYH